MCNKAYREANPEKVKVYNKTYREKNPDKVSVCNKAWRKAKCKTDPKFRLCRNISNAIYIALRGNKSGRHWEDLVGYSLNQLRAHLGKQLKEGMTWENYGLWHIDHRIPISVHNFTEIEHADFKRCFALKNLQPMWSEDNFKKHAKLDKHFQPSLLI